MLYFSIYLRRMQVDVLIIGQGICGTMLSWFLFKEGKTFLVIDDAAEDSPSRVAAGVINPVTGRRYATSWMAEELHQFAWLTYNEIGNYFETSLIAEKSIIDFFPTAQMRNTFVDRISENDTYLHAYPDQNLFNAYFNYDFGCGEVRPAYTVHLQWLLSAWRKKLAEMDAILPEKFSIEELAVSEDGVKYGPVTAQKIIFCDGLAATGNPWFSLLPFSPNKGEALFIDCPEMNNEHSFKRGMLLVPLREEGKFWLGSNYQWEFDNTAPSEKFYKAAIELLQHWLKKPFTVLAHKASVRPATLERRPFVGFHPSFTAVGILNGMGTKGASLAPFFAHQLVQHIVHGLPIAPQADIHRFNRILTK